MDFDEFTQEVVNNCGFRMEPRTLKMYLEDSSEVSGGQCFGSDLQQVLAERDGDGL